MKNEGSHKLQKSIWDKDMAKLVKKRIYRAKTVLISHSNKEQARDGCTESTVLTQLNGLGEKAEINQLRDF